jgi:hypothetical protein
MSITRNRSVRSVVAVAFTLSALFVWNHQRVVKTAPTQVATTTDVCWVINGRIVCI